MMLRLRPYKACDAAAIVSWSEDEAAFRRWSADRFPAYPITAEDLIQHYDAMDGSDSFFEFTDDEKTTLRFGFVIVDPRKRGQGYGREMMNLAVRYAFDFLKVKRITLGVFENNLPAYRCYRAAGFRETPNCGASWYTIGTENWKCIEMELTKGGRSAPEP